MIQNYNAKNEQENKEEQTEKEKKTFTDDITYNSNTEERTK